MEPQIKDLALRTAGKLLNQGVNVFERILRLRRDFGFSLTEAKEIDLAAQDGRVISLWERQQELVEVLGNAE